MLFEIIQKVKQHKIKECGDVVVELHRKDLENYSIRSLKKYLKHRGYDFNIKKELPYLDEDGLLNDGKIIMTIKVGL